MTFEEEQRLYRVLFEDSEEEIGNEIYELYDTLSEVIKDKVPSLPQIERVLH